MIGIIAHHLADDDDSRDDRDEPSHPPTRALPPRDVDYIEARLLAPATPALEAYARLREAGLLVEAGRLMEAMHAFRADCRKVHRDLLAKGGSL